MVRLRSRITLPTVMNQINGVWGLELMKDEVVIDTFGDVTKRAESSDPWRFIDSWAYRKR